MDKNTTIGMLAHVDAGKTTLSEAILFKLGIIKECGKVDNRNTFLDTDEIERNRGITVFTKNAKFTINDRPFTLIDTPGHVDFSAEMERSLQVLDYAVLIINASDMVTGHTKTLWRMLDVYNIPTFIFVNKMDQHGNEKEVIINELRNNLSEYIIDFSDNLDYELIATSDENALELYLQDEKLDTGVITDLIVDRKVFPCFFGSALKMIGIDEFIDALDKYSVAFDYGDEFAAKVYKIGRDENKNRLTFMKITGGTLSNRQAIEISGKNITENEISKVEKVNQIRIYNGEKYKTVNEVSASEICAVVGLENTYAGQGLGKEALSEMPLIESVLTYKIILPDDISPRQFYPDIKKLEEEIPELDVCWDEHKEEITVKIMGKVQLEIINNLCKRKFGFEVSFDKGSITYKETIENSVIGVGHFEPLRHYAEVHLLLEPGEPGSGIVVKSDLREEVLAKNWQRLIYTHLNEKSFVGVLTGSQLTDVVITLINGRASNKHTEGGDFRQATYRAVRQGLMQAENVLLEPYYSFNLKIGSNLIGKVMTDIEQLHGKIGNPEIQGDVALIKGIAPLETLRDYHENLSLYTKGTGNMEISFAGYYKCHNQEEVISKIKYNPENDIINTPDSVFCDKGAGFIVPWYKVSEYMHVIDEQEKNIIEIENYAIKNRNFDYSIGTDEIDEILNRTYNSNQRKSKALYKKKKQIFQRDYKAVKTYSTPSKKAYIIDGYNIIFANRELEELAKVNIDSAKDKLIQTISNYYSICEIRMIIVFDGYKVKGNKGSETIIDNVEVVHTKEGVTADAYIEKFTNENNKDYSLTVVSSDALIQQLSRGHNCMILSSREMMKRIEDEVKAFNEFYGVKA